MKAKNSSKKIVFKTFNEIEKHYLPNSYNQSSDESDMCVRESIHMEKHLKELRELLSNKV